MSENWYVFFDLLRIYYFFKQNAPKYKIYCSEYADVNSGAKVRLTFQEFEEKSKFHQNAQMFELFH